MVVEFSTRFDQWSTKPNKDLLTPTVKVVFEMAATPELMGQLVQVFGQQVRVRLESAQSSLDDYLAKQEPVTEPEETEASYPFTVDVDGNVIDGEHRLLPALAGPEDDGVSAGTRERRRQRTVAQADSIPGELVAAGAEWKSAN